MTEALSRTPLTDKFVSEMEAMVVPVELQSHPRVIAQLRQLMIDWAEFARTLEELSNVLRENYGEADGEKK